MHLDEAILGLKSLSLWAGVGFDYDPRDYHGPMLHYVSAAASWLLGWGADVSEGQLRGICAVCGVALLVVSWGLVDGLGRVAVVASSVLLAVSPMQVFYSRYYIMEMLLVLELALFLVVCWRYTQGRSVVWLALAGLLLGAMHATKETFIIHLLAMACGWLVVRVVVGGFSTRSSGLRLGMGSARKGLRKPWLWVLGVAVVTSVLLFSRLSRWEDVLQSVTTYGSYQERSAGAGGHEKPFFYYLQLLTWNKSGPLLWTEALILALAFVGMVQACFGTFIKQEHQQALRLFLSVYAVAGLIGYSIIPYKTPWTLLGIQWAFILLAGLGVQTLYGKAAAGRLRWALHLGLGLGIYHLCQQSMLAIHNYKADPRNPYVYSHTSTQAVKLVARMKELAAFSPESFSAQVISSDQGWPLPWYLRHEKKVGYQSSPPATLTAPVIVVDTAQEEATTLLLAGREYMPDYFGLRPGLPVTLLIEKKLWEAELASRTQKKHP
jgi:uncharacterized protein (TIGR03663 family)